MIKNKRDSKVQQLNNSWMACCVTKYLQRYASQKAPSLLQNNHYRLIDNNGTLHVTSASKGRGKG